MNYATSTSVEGSTAFHASLNEALKADIVTVTFTKVDGSTRVMKCTKNLELVPSDKYPVQSALPTAKNDSTQRVFDFDKQDWRSFRKDSVSSWE